MTAHQLAKRLLEGPDLVVVIRNDEVEMFDEIAHIKEQRDCAYCPAGKVVETGRGDALWLLE